MEKVDSHLPIGIYVKMARRIQNLIESTVDFSPEDVIYFTFKRHKFSAHVNSAGFIHNVAWTTPNNAITTVFSQRSFESLTDWTETCIQEKLDEYHTRYSAWRRVKHARTMKTMETLHKECTRMALGTQPSKLTNSELLQLHVLSQQHALELTQKCTLYQKALDQWEKWYMHSNTVPLPVQNPFTMSDTPESPKTEAVQPIVLNSPSGTYLVIQRMTEKHPEAVQTVQNLGLSGFRKLADKFTAENKTWHPPETSYVEGWWTDGVGEINKHPRKVARLVYEFFKK